MAKNYLRLDKIPATGHIESVVSDSEELVAGQFVELGAVLNVAEGEEVSYTKATEGGAFDALVAPVFLDNELDPVGEVLEKTIAIGKPARAFILQKGDMVSFNAENAADVEAGDDVKVGANGLGVAKAAESDTVIGKCIAVEFEPGVGDLAVIRFA
jgi:hypothetical protein